MRSSDFPPIVEPRGVSHGKDSTRMQVITRGAAQANKILADFKGHKTPVKKSVGGAVHTCGCGGPVRK